MYHSGKNSGHVSLQGALQLKIVLVTMTFGLNHISWINFLNAFIIGCSAMRKWRAKRATRSAVAAAGGQAPKASSPPQELGIANPRAARVWIPSLKIKLYSY